MEHRADASVVKIKDEIVNVDIKQEHDEYEDGYKHLVETGAYYPVSIKAEPIYTIEKPENLLTEEINTQRRAYSPRAGGYNCAICGDTFKWKKTLQQHMEKHEAENRQVEATTESCMVTIKQDTDDCEAEADQLAKPKLAKHIKIEPADDIAGAGEMQTTGGRDNTEVIVEIKQETEEVGFETERSVVTHLTHAAVPLNCEGERPITRTLEEMPKNKPERYTCEMCRIVFERESLLMRHMKTHKDKKFMCSVCGLSSVSMSYVRVHQKSHSTPIRELDEGSASENQAVGTQRNASYKTTGNPRLWDLMATKTSVKPYECDYCDFQTIFEGVLSRHLRTHMGNRPFACSLCSYKTTVRSRLKRHMRIHTEDTYNCLKCDFKTKHQSSFLVHIQGHSGKRYQCYACDFKTLTKQALSRHEKQHGSVKPHGCSLCGFMTFNKAYLAAHMKRQHVNEKSNECSMRGFKTVYQAALERHERKIHTGEKPYECSVCDFNTFTQSLLISHLQKHSVDKPYECFLCDFKTAKRASLTVHEGKHIGVEPHECPVCRYKTFHKGNLTIHMRRHTDEIL